MPSSKSDSASQKGGLAALNVNLPAEDGEAKSIAQLVPMQWREGQRVAKVAHEGECFLRIGLRKVKAHEETRVGVGFQCAPLLYSRMPSMALAAMTWSPSRIFRRAARSGRLLARGRLRPAEGKQCDDFAALADLDVFPFANPIKDSAEVVSHLSDRGCFHVPLSCDTMNGPSTGSCFTLPLDQ